MSKLTSARVVFGIVIALVVLRFGTPTPLAQGSGITFAKFNGLPSWPSGPDYATDVLRDPWDFCNVEDVVADPNIQAGWSSFSVNANNSCLAGGHTTPVNGFRFSTMGLLYPGFYNTLSPTRNGRKFPVDTSRYQNLAFRLTASSAGGAPQFYWFHYPFGDPRDPQGAGNGMKQLATIAAGAQIYSTDLTTNKNTGLDYTAGVVSGFRLDRNGASTDTDLFYDWVRLTVKDSDPAAAMQTVSWNFGTGTTTISVVDAANTVLTIGSVGSNVTSFTFNYGILPPGNYKLRVTRDSVQERSFTVNAPATIDITDPNETGGEDYSTAVLHNPWDMSSPSAIPYTGFENITPNPPDFSNGMLNATNTNGGANIMLFSNGNNGVPIDTSRYRYFTARFEVEGAFDLGNGSVARVLWTSQGGFNGDTATTTKSFVVFPGMNTYTIDLATLTTAQDDGLEPYLGTPETWTAAAKRYLNFHPHEFVEPRTFHIDYVKLAAMAETVNGGFTLKWNGRDADGGSPTVALYYDTDTNPSNGKTLIASNLAMSSGQYFWNTAGVPLGVYWIYAEGNDGVQVYGRYSTGQVRVVNAAPVSSPVMVVDAPVAGASIAQPYALSGWTLDRGATSGTGMDAVHVWAFPDSGAPGIFAGAATMFGRRDDVGAIFGSQFTNSGFHLALTGLPAGAYHLQVFGHSTVTGTFNIAQVIPVTVPASSPLMAFDAPAPGSTVSSSFAVSGWTLDLGAPPAAGSGIDYIDGWAWPMQGGGSLGTGISLGRLTARTARQDVANIFGSQFLNSGFSFNISTLPAGSYRIVLFGHSVVAGAFNISSSVDVNVAGSASNPAMVLDAPKNGATVSPSFTVSGWAVDRGATTGTGVSAVHVWAFPTNGSAAVFLGAATYGTSRPDVASVLGNSRFTNSGYTLNATGLQHGVTYDIVAFMFSTVPNAPAPSYAVSARVAVQ
jgi:hypothetical protein